ncbi:2-dehydro-3-deoxygalactonokinase [Mesorhizobium sp. DCY119]|jgi:2-dehydro-3-deoxygalactonokinase|uniref:2-dehydro-3-deoxygalactonokinase n=1 Tax=Mesorhizobium sp. DCY119 TaxID=2108445 RepID=UPI000E6B7DC3|nr:2-dehydro-3-deoxygalactonokinase [Mesorhizobium sp. DCY119]RJG43248.1 2-dehydro-3-deoxygalactonokinase [Mesorhizobium sp. DCY119]
MPNPAIAAADWGTSHLRVWLLDADGNALAERRSAEGLLSVKPGGFSDVLESHLDAMGAPATLSVIICGMAGSRQGWIEAPYVFVPASIGDILAGAVAAPGTRRDVRIIPGIAQRDESAPDVMRGEETQLAGIAELSSGSHLVCMPGTHSKWVETNNGAVSGFGSWLTGELFSLLSRQSILRHSLGESPASVSPDNATFRHWCANALSEGGDIGAHLFRIRASTLLLDLSPPDAAAALSGLLIGAEIASARRRFAGAGGPVTLVASSSLAKLYEAALHMAGREVRVVDGDAVVRAGLFAAARHNGMIGSIGTQA